MIKTDIEKVLPIRGKYLIAGENLAYGTGYLHTPSGLFMKNPSDATFYDTREDALEIIPQWDKANDPLEHTLSVVPIAVSCELHDEIDRFEIKTTAGIIHKN